MATRGNATTRDSRTAVQSITPCLTFADRAEEAISFYVLAALILLSGILVVSARNTVYSVLFLVANFLCVAVIYLLLHAAAYVLASGIASGALGYGAWALRQRSSSGCAKGTASSPAASTSG